MSNNYSLSVAGGQLNLSFNINRGSHKISAAIYDLNCHAQGSRGEVGGKGQVYEALAWCMGYNQCVQFSLLKNDGTWWQAGGTNRFGFDFTTDDDKGQRLVRAFSHLLAVLQQQYKQSHSDPNDPFAKPQ